MDSSPVESEFEVNIELFSTAKEYSDELLLDFFVQVNIAETRTLINQWLATPILLALCAEPAKDKLAKLLNVLCKDEMRHIAYTGKLIERLSPSFDLDSLVIERLRGFSEITSQEIAGDKPH